MIELYIKDRCVRGAGSVSIRYHLGEQAPHFPVPAIPYDVTFTSYDVIMWRDEQSRECVAAWFFD